MTVYRDTGAIAHGHPEIRESAYHVGLSMIEQAACYGAPYVGAALFTMPREEAEDPERYQSSFFQSLDVWKRWMADAKRLGVKRLLVETSAAYREGCSTIDETRTTLHILESHHAGNPGTSVPVGICYDTGHGISVAENRDDSNRDFRAWFAAFPDKIVSVHLKNTDGEFLETKHFGLGEGIIDPKAVLESLRDTLTVPDVIVNLEVPGKRGREVGERRSIEEHLRSIHVVREALASLGYREDPEDGTWVCR
jgi:sugar phosphate isomerase/epimerase